MAWARERRRCDIRERREDKAPERDGGRGEGGGGSSITCPPEEAVV